MNHLDYFARAYAQPRYRSAGNYDLDYVPWNCLRDARLRNIPSSRILELQRGALRARARAMYTTAGDCRDANFAIASVLAERFRAHQAKKAG